MEELLQYFMRDAGFSRLMEGMWDLFARHGRCFGAVRLLKPYDYEEKALSEFFKRDYYNQALIRISLADFERQLHRVFPEAPGLGVLLEGYFARPLTSHLDDNKERVRVRDSFASYVKTEILPEYEGTEAEHWLREMIAHMRRTYKQWAERFITDPDPMVEQVKTVCNALNALSQDEYILLSDFSERICGHPQSLDFYGSHGPLFLRALARRYNVPIPNQLEDSISLYWQAGLLSNGVLNNVTVLGLLAYGDVVDTACEYYDSLGEAHVLTLENISRFTRAVAYKRRVFIVESANVFALLCERLRGLRCTLVCAASGMNAALDRLLTLCYESGADLYYSGNMDLKGLLLGDGMYSRFGKRFKPWRYKKADYEQALTYGHHLLPDEKKDVALHNDTFASLLSLIRKNGKTASHLPLVEILAADIKKYMGGL
ncbi:MAG: TIGR02679 domain-containing protein [Defluviitaleaceae bacterium]|nr:TIGR02679 domain-containing protein [Defluviitaleaceae bacterium]MCL2238481.1 TIGR02679 domain-containing protein [Defluviitaleaceae bacterium]